MQYEHYFFKIWIIYCSFCIAIALQTIFFFPKIWQMHPSWVMILLVYWVMMSPCQVNIGTGFFLGLILDILLDSILGIHSLSLSAITYLIVRKIYFLKYVSIWIQSILIIFFSLINQCIILIITFLIDKITCSAQILWHCVIDGSVWPIIVLLMNKINNMYNKYK